MKKLLHVFSREVVALFVVSQIATGLVFDNFLEGIIVTGVALAIASYVVKPVVNLLLLPVNLATLGLFRFVSHAITLFIVDIALTQFSVTSFHFVGLSSRFLDLPSLSAPQGPLSYLGFSLLLFVVVSLLG